MPEVVQYDVDSDCIFVRSFGDLLVEEMHGSRAEIERLHREHGVARVFVDTRDVTSVPGTFPLFQFGCALSEADLSPTLRLAVVGIATFLLDFEFLETVLRNRGIAIRLFEDVEAARRWLGLS